MLGDENVTGYRALTNVITVLPTGALLLPVPGRSEHLAEGAVKELAAHGFPPNIEGVYSYTIGVQQCPCGQILPVGWLRVSERHGCGWQFVCCPQHDWPQGLRKEGA